MWETWKEMFQFLQGYYNNGIVLWIYVVSFLTIMFWGGKRLRKLIGWPALALMIIVFNPFFYRYVWQKCFHYGYWRVFWLVPVTFVVSAAAIVWYEKIKQQKKQLVFLLVLIFFIGCNGKNMFAKQMFYTDTRNAYKLPQEAIDVADALLELDTEPRVVMCSELYSYVRQYSTDIKMMYGRNVDGYIDGMNEDSMEVAKNLKRMEEGNWQHVVTLMKNAECDYLVIPQDERCTEDYMQQYSFECLKQVDGYNIFKLKF